MANQPVQTVNTSGDKVKVGLAICAAVVGVVGFYLLAGQSTLVRWLGQNRDRRAVEPPEVQNDVAAELKRLRRENEILRQERDILKKATAFFAREGNR